MEKVGRVKENKNRKTPVSETGGDGRVKKKIEKTPVSETIYLN